MPSQGLLAEKLSNETSRPESTNRPTFPDESSKIEFNDAVRFIKAVLPESSDDGLRKQEILDKRSGTDGNFSASTLDRALAWLGKQGEVGEKQLMNERGKPKVYWRAYNPLGDGEEGGGLFPPNPLPVMVRIKERPLSTLMSGPTTALRSSPPC